MDIIWAQQMLYVKFCYWNPLFDSANMSEEEKAKYIKEKKDKQKQELKEKQIKLRQVLQHTQT